MKKASDEPGGLCMTRSDALTILATAAAPYAGQKVADAARFLMRTHPAGSPARLRYLEIAEEAERRAQ
jgi:hypothetical protein